MRNHDGEDTDVTTSVATIIQITVIYCRCVARDVNLHQLLQQAPKNLLLSMWGSIVQDNSIVEILIRTEE
jgi:hypothetical protein